MTCENARSGSGVWCWPTTTTGAGTREGHVCGDGCGYLCGSMVPAGSLAGLAGQGLRGSLRRNLNFEDKAFL